MIRLVDVELRRALARRGIRLLVAVGALLIIVSAVITFFVSKPGFDESTARQKATVARQAEVERCTRESPGAPCEQFVGPTSSFIKDKRFHMERMWGKPDPVLGGLSPILLIGALIGGATVLGGEWRHGTIGTLLTWEPRRGRVLAAKLLSVALAAFVIAVLLEVLLLAALYPSAIWRGTTAGMTATWWRGLIGGVLRIGVVASALAVLAACVASLGRNTAAALGVAFGYLIIGENVVRALRPKWQPWLLGNNGATVVVGHKLAGLRHAKSLTAAAVLLALYLAALIAVTAASFVRRDVT